VPSGSDAQHWRVALELGAVATIESEVDEFLAARGVDDHATFVARLVIEEITRNLVDHAGPGAVGEVMDIELRVGSDAVTVVVEDTCRPFDPADGPDLDTTTRLEDRRPGGMGLHLVRSMSDDLVYEHVEERNRLTATVRRT
jgi:serine/threonine-protein kinase RsbW